MPQSIHTLSCEDAQAFVWEAAFGCGEVDPNGKFVWANPAYWKILNAPLELILLKRHEDWVDPEDREQCKLMLDQVLQGSTASFTLAMKYVPRGSTPQHRRTTWGELSASGKWSPTNEFLGYRVQFRPYDNLPAGWHLPDFSKLGTGIVEVAKWSIKNWKLVVFATVVLTALIRGDSEQIISLLKEVQKAKQSVDGLSQP